MNRSRLPSGEKRIAYAAPETVINFRTFVPSALAKKMSDPLANASCRPSGDHTAPWATIFERWRGVPVGRGNTQACASFSKPT